MEKDVPKPRRGSILASLPAVAIVHAAIPAGILWFLVVRVPGIRQGFADMGVALPTVTVLLLSLSAFATRHLLVAAAVAGGALAVDLSAYYLLRQAEERLWARLWWWFVMGIETLVALIAFNAVYLPYRALANALGL